MRHIHTIDEFAENPTSGQYGLARYGTRYATSQCHWCNHRGIFNPKCVVVKKDDEASSSSHKPAANSFHGRPWRDATLAASAWRNMRHAPNFVSPISSFHRKPIKFKDLSGTRISVANRTQRCTAARKISRDFSRENYHSSEPQSTSTYLPWPIKWTTRWHIFICELPESRSSGRLDRNERFEYFK